MLLNFAAMAVLTSPQETLVYKGDSGPGKGRHVVFLAGDEEYRSEEALPQLARILAFRHGFTCTVVFSLDKEGVIDPETRDNQPGIEALDKADLCVMMLRFRQWPDSQMKHLADFRLAGKPIIALRTSTHAFQFPPDSKSRYSHFGWQGSQWEGGFGRHVLGETWLSHWGVHGQQATRGVPVADRMGHPVMRGVQELFGTTDVYEAHPPSDAVILVRGQVLAGMDRASEPASGVKTTVGGSRQEVNDPMMPIVWTRLSKNEAGTVNSVLTCTMGSATDLLDEGVRRLLVNAAFWSLAMDRGIRADLDVSLVGDYEPSPFGFGGFKKGVRPSDLTWPRKQGKDGECQGIMSLRSQ